MSFPRQSIPILSVALCVALLVALLPTAVLAAPQGKPREYMVTLDVADSGRFIEPSSKARKTRIRQRAKHAHDATERIKREHGVKPRHRFGHAFTGFSAKLTPEQAAQLAMDPEVVAIRPARTFRIAAQYAPPGIKRVKARNGSTVPGPDVNAHVAVLDTGIGPSRTAGGERTGEPVAMTPAGAEELNIRGGINCYDNPWTQRNEAALNPGFWADTYGHGTHVAGIIGARDNNVGVVGVAPGVRLWSVRVFEGTAGSEASITCGLDWVIARNSDGNSGNDIDVVNMSIQGPRLDLREHCPTVLADRRGDPIQQGICTLSYMGVTVVASAGNDGMDANLSSPGGFDRVISVGALTDTDGSGWGEGSRADCPGYGRERDDTYAKYSNRGREIDIVAPGTCVASTSSWDRTGDSMLYMTGTSMAAPHVTGAVARYIASSGSPASTWAMRDLVRASGRLDWDTKSDPVYHGVNDPDPPNRVLDVRALTGGPFLRTWILHDRFRISGDSRIRTTRVDVQRGGGYAGTANLSVTGLSGVGSASFGDGTLEGMGRKDLGTNVNFDVKRSGNEGVHTLRVRANGSGVDAHSRALTLTVDRTGPKVSGLLPRLRAGRAGLSAKGGAQTTLEWQVSDTLSSVKSAKLQRRIGAGAWRSAGTSGSLTGATVSLKPGQSNKFRVKARDSAGNTSYSPAIAARLSIRDSSSPQWLRPASGGWKTKQVSKAHGGSIVIASEATDSLSTTFNGVAVALVASIGPSRGTLQVRVDGGAWSDVSLRSSRAGHRKVTWSRKLAAGAHTLEVRGASGQATVDALLILR